MPFLAPIFTAVSGFFGSLGILGKAVLAIGLNILSQALRDSASSGNDAVSGAQFERQYGEGVSRKVACGLVGLAGHDCYVNTYGSANKYLEQIYVLSDFPCDGLSRIWAGGKLLTLTTTDNKTYAVSSGDMAGLVSFVFYNGTQTAADADLVAHSNPVGRWTTNHVGTGVCWIKVLLTFDQEKLSNFPDFFFEVRGARLYDPRKDSTVGGAGAHRFGVYSTYEYSENPVIIDYNYRRGFSINDDLFLGMDMPASDLPVDKYAIAANICDEIVSGVKRYTCSVMLDADNTHGENIEALMLSCGGMVLDGVDGCWPVIGTAQPVVAVFTDGDLALDEDIRFQRRRSMADLVNSVSGTYPEPSNQWSPAGYDTQTQSGLVVVDRRTRDASLSFPTVRVKGQANRLAAIYLAENRYEATADIVLRPRFQTIKAGDWVQWNSARYGNRVYMVQSRAIRALSSDGPRNVALSLQERDASIYSGVSPGVITMPLPPGQPVYLNELQDFTAIAILAVANNGRTVPAIRASWSPFDDVTVTGIQLQWWSLAAPDTKFSATVTPGTTLRILQEGVIPLTQYAVRHRLIADRATLWSATVEVTTSINPGGLEVYLTDIKKDVLDRFAELQSDVDEIKPLLKSIITDAQTNALVSNKRVSEVRAEVNGNVASVVETVEVAISNLASLASQVVELDAEFNENKATVEARLTAVSNASTALSNSLTALSATVANNKANADTSLSALSTALNAVSSSVTDLTAAVADVSASGQVKFAVAAAPAGVDARFSILIKATAGGTYKDTGLYLELYTVSGVLKSRLAVKADQFVVTDGTDSALPMVFEGGALKLQIANIGTVTAGTLQSSNGKMVINLAAGSIVINS